MARCDYTDQLKDRIDITHVPFSDRGSRLLVFKAPDKDDLYVKLAERLTSIQPGLDTYRFRPPYIQDLRFVDEEGMPLTYRLTTYPHVLLFQTRLGTFQLAFQQKDTLAIGLPPNVAAGVHFRVSTQLWQMSDDGGSLVEVRNLFYRTNGQVLKNELAMERDAYAIGFIVNGDDDIAIQLNIRSQSRPEGAVVPFAETLAAAEERWNNWFCRVPPVAECYQNHYYYAWWVMKNNLVAPSGRVEHEAMMPSKVEYVGIWNWDTCFHSLAFRYLDPELARNQLRTMLACQLPDGMIPDAVYDEGVVADLDHPLRASVTKPPIMAWAALKLHEMDPDPQFLQEIYVPLVRWNAWWFSMNDDDADGLVQYNHPYSSGLDDSPLWDYGMPVESPDLNTYLCVQMGSLALIAEALGMDAEATMWRRRAAAIVRRMIKDFRDEEAGLFRALHDEQPVPVITPFNLYPLWTGQLPEAMRDRLIAHLTDPEQFWGEYAIPSVARNDPHYEPETMWRGPVWANINYIFIEALRQVGQFALADELLDKTLNLIMSQPGLYEYYRADTGEPPSTAAAAFGWTAAVFIDLAIQASRRAEGGPTGGA
jgi:Mannosylglycerate hydrolase MGH1-like glycoside hydrolase domain